MALTELIFNITPASIGVVVLDASVKEMHTARATATRHPIEAEPGGQSDVSDHVHVDPLSLQIEGVVTNTPVEWLAAFADPGERAQEAHQELLDSLLSGKLITIVTTLREYSNMVLEQLQVTRDATKGNALYLNATASMMCLVTLEETELGQTADQTTQSGGTKAAKATPETAPAVESKSALLKIFGG